MLQARAESVGRSEVYIGTSCHLDFHRTDLKLTSGDVTDANCK